MYFRPYSNLSDHDFGLLVFLITPLVFLLAWLYNAKKLGKFKKKKHVPSNTSLHSGTPKWLLLLCGILLGILLALIIRAL